MNIEPYKIVCDACGWRGNVGEVLVAPNPFRADEEIHGCTRCFSIDQFSQVCDEPGCVRVVSCGTPTPEGYRNTCGKHQPKPATVQAPIDTTPVGDCDSCVYFCITNGGAGGCGKVNGLLDFNHALGYFIAHPRCKYKFYSRNL